MTFTRTSFAAILGAGAVFLWGVLDALGTDPWPVLPDSLTFLNLPSLAIVLGGIYIHALISFPLPVVTRATRAFLRFFSHLSVDTADIDAEMERMTAWQRSVLLKGPSAWDDLARDLPPSYERYVASLLATPYKVETARQMAEIHSLEHTRRLMESSKVLGVMGNVAPAFGMLGTLFGLILMLGNFEEAQQLASGLAIALMTTLFGLVFSQLVFLPMAQKLRSVALASRERDRLMLDAMLLIASGASSMEVYDRFKAYVTDRTHAG